MAKKMATFLAIIALILCCFCSVLEAKGLWKKDVPSRLVKREDPTAGKNASAVPPGICQRPIDLVFVLDSSESVGDENWIKIVNFTIKLSQKFDVRYTRFGVIQFHSSPEVPIILSSFPDNKTLSDTIGKIYFKAGSTRTELAAIKLLDVFKAATHRRATKVAIFVLGGLSSDVYVSQGERINAEDLLKEPAAKLRKAGIAVYAAGVEDKLKGDDLNKYKVEMNTLVSEPPTEHIVEAPSFGELLSGKVDAVAKKTCIVNGGWGDWSDWSTCSVTCGGGTQLHMRACDNPKPVNDGLLCTGPTVEQQACNMQPCGDDKNVHGNASPPTTSTSSSSSASSLPSPSSSNASAVPTTPESSSPSPSLPASSSPLPSSSPSSSNALAVPTTPESSSPSSSSPASSLPSSPSSSNAPAVPTTPESSSPVTAAISISPISPTTTPPSSNPSLPAPSSSQPSSPNTTSASPTNAPSMVATSSNPSGNVSPMMTSYGNATSNAATPHTSAPAPPVPAAPVATAAPAPVATPAPSSNTAAPSGTTSQQPSKPVTYGTPDTQLCGNNFEMIKLTPDQLSASSIYTRDTQDLTIFANHEPTNGLLYNVQRAGAWCAEHRYAMANDQSQFYAVDLGVPTLVGKVATQGMHRFPNWVKTFALKYSTDARLWSTYRTVLHGNFDQNTVVENILNPPISARYLQFNPLTWNTADGPGKNDICMRVGVYKCRSCDLVPIARCLTRIAIAQNDISNKSKIERLKKHDAHREHKRIQKTKKGN